MARRDLKRFKFEAELPDWVDSRARLKIVKGAFVITHPEHKTIRLNKKLKQWVEV